MSTKSKTAPGTSGPAATTFENPRKSGYMTKHGGKGFTANWKRRWFILDNHYLFYYASPHEKDPLGIVCLADYTECRKVQSSDPKQIVKKNENMLILKSSGGVDGKTSRDYYMFPDSESDMQNWIKAISEEVEEARNAEKGGTLPSRSFARESGVAKESTDGSVFSKSKLKKDDKKAFDEVTKLAGETTPLQHITASRPKGPQRRKPRKYQTYDEDDEVAVTTPKMEHVPVWEKAPESPSRKSKASVTRQPLLPNAQLKSNEVNGKLGNGELSTPPPHRAKEAGPPPTPPTKQKITDPGPPPTVPTKQKSADPGPPPTPPTKQKMADPGPPLTPPTKKAADPGPPPTPPIKQKIADPGPPPTPPTKETTADPGPPPTPPTKKVADPGPPPTPPIKETTADPGPPPTPATKEKTADPGPPPTPPTKEKTADPGPPPTPPTKEKTADPGPPPATPTKKVADPGPPPTPPTKEKTADPGPPPTPPTKEKTADPGPPPTPPTKEKTADPGPPPTPPTKEKTADPGPPPTPPTKEKTADPGPPPTPPTKEKTADPGPPSTPPTKKVADSGPPPTPPTKKKTADPGPPPTSAEMNVSESPATYPPPPVHSRPAGRGSGSQSPTPYKRRSSETPPTTPTINKPNTINEGSDAPLTAPTNTEGTPSTAVTSAQPVPRRAPRGGFNKPPPPSRLKRDNTNAGNSPTSPASTDTTNTATLPKPVPRPRTRVGSKNSDMEDSYSEHRKSDVKTESTVEKAESTVEKAESTVKKAESIEKAESTVEKAEPTVEKVESTVEKAESTVEKAESTVVKAESTVEKVESTVEKAESTIEKAESTVEKVEHDSKDAVVGQSKAGETSETTRGEHNGEEVDSGMNVYPSMSPGSHVPSPDRMVSPVESDYDPPPCLDKVHHTASDSCGQSEPDQSDTRDSRSQRSASTEDEYEPMDELAKEIDLLPSDRRGYEKMSTARLNDILTESTTNFPTPPRVHRYDKPRPRGSPFHAPDHSGIVPVLPRTLSPSGLSSTSNSSEIYEDMPGSSLQKIEDHEFDHFPDTPVLCLSQAKEVLHLARIARKEAEEMRRKAKQELEVAEREKKEAEVIRRHALEILKIAKEKLPLEQK